MSDEQDKRVPQEAYIPATPPRRRRPKHRTGVYRRPVSVARIVIMLAGVAVLAAGGWLYLQHWQAHVAIYVKEKPIVALADHADAAQVILDVKRQTSRTVPDVVRFKEEPLEVRSIKTNALAPTHAEAVKRLAAVLTPYQEGFAIYVNRKPLVLLASKDQAAQTIALMQQRGARGKQGYPTFKERVVILPYTQDLHSELIIPAMTPEKAAAMLVRPPLPNFHTVQKGDSFYVIAVANGITVDLIRSLNPGLDPHALQPGDQIKLPDIPSPVTVVMRGNTEG